MKPKLLRAAAAFLFTFLVAQLSAQDIDSMMAMYAEKLPLEKMHIHFDKNIYNKAETVWYKVYILHSAETSMPSKNVYLEWYDADGKMIKQTVAPLIQSTAKGSFDIPADYKGENLTVRAFTKWMLNDDPAFAYEKQLPVNNGSLQRPARPAAQKTKFEIFPEGGFLVQGLNTRIAFKATNPYGQPVFVKAILVDNTGNTIDSFAARHDGMGSFYLNPLPQQSYKVNWTDENGVAGSTPVEVSKTDGARLDIKTTPDKARFQVDRTATAPGNFKHMTLLVHMNKVALYRVNINAAEKTTLTGDLPIANLPAGILQFTLFTSDQVPVAERIVFINKQTYRFNTTISAPVTGLAKRAKNVLEIAVDDTTLSNMSIAVTDASLTGAGDESIFSDMLLSSEIKGRIHNPAYYFSNDADSVKDHLDLVMLTNGWRRFDWEQIKKQVPPKISHVAETEYMKLKGKVSGLKRNSEASMNLIMRTKDSSRQFVVVPIDKTGSFSQDVFFYDTARAYYSFTDPKLNAVAKAQFETGLMKPEPGKKITVANNASAAWSDSLAKSKLDVILAEQELLRKKMSEATLQEVTVNTTAKTKEQVLSEKYSTGFFARNEAAIFDLTDSRYITAQNVFEYLQGKVPGLEIRGANIGWRGFETSLFLNEMQLTSESKQTILDLPMNEVAMIKVFRPPFMFATGGGRGGAVAVWTKKGGDDKWVKDEAAGLENAMITGYTQFREFYSPSYETPDASATPQDKRVTLYWNPYVVTGGKSTKVQVEFYNNDITKKFQVVLEGINEAGKMTRVVKTIE